MWNQRLITGLYSCLEFHFPMKRAIQHTDNFQVRITFICLLHFEIIGLKFKIKPNRKTHNVYAGLSVFVHPFSFQEGRKVRTH